MVLYETLWLVTLLMVLIATAHVTVVKIWNRRLELLQQKRLRYDGEVIWKP